MNPTLEGVVTLKFIKADKSKKGACYVILANGRKEFFVWLDNQEEVDLFSEYEEDQDVDLTVRLTAGNESVKIVSVG